MKNKYRSDLAIAKNLGSAGSGSAHWWHQRVTGVVLTIATIWLICFSWNLSGLEVSGIIEVVKKTLQHSYACILYYYWVLSCSPRNACHT